MFLIQSILILVTASFGASSIVNNSDPTVIEICSLLPPNKYILRPHTCDHWVKCPSIADLHDYEEGTCVVGLSYDKDDGRCTFANTVECPFAPASLNRCADKTDNAFLADPESKNCRGYIFCKNGREQRAACPGELVFNPKQGVCAYAEDYKCPKSDIKIESSPICRSIQNKQAFANEADCTLYHNCLDNVLMTHECDYDMAFDHLTGRCVDKERVVCHPTARHPPKDSKVCGDDGHAREGYITDSQSCQGYYICTKQEDRKADRHPVHMQCENGLFFDETKWSCRDRLNVRCPLDRCEGMANKFVNIAGDCTAYARCQNGMTVATGHCPEKTYFDERTQGCTAQNINYIACAPIENKATVVVHTN